MFGPAAAYFVAFAAMLFAAICALALIRSVNHFDPPEAHSSPEAFHEKSVA